MIVSCESLFGELNYSCSVLHIQTLQPGNNIFEFIVIRFPIQSNPIQSNPMFPLSYSTLDTLYYLT